MKRIYLIMLMITAMMVSCNPKDEDDNNNSGGNGNNGGGNDQYNGYEYVDLGLPSGLKWATCNVGASKPEEYGDYFAWGETSPKERYEVYNSLTYGLSISELQAQGIIDGNNNLTPQHDAATVNWGGSWRMPTREEMLELVEHCEWEWTQVNGVDGAKVTGPNGNSIFLPAAGCRIGSSLIDNGDDGYYWSSIPNDYDGGYYGSFACNLSFFYADEYVLWFGDRYDGLTVRSITE